MDEKWKKRDRTILILILVATMASRKGSYRTNKSLSVAQAIFPNDFRNSLFSSVG